MQLQVIFVLLALTFSKAEEAEKNKDAETMHGGYGGFAFGGPQDFGQSFELKHNNLDLRYINLPNGLGISYVSSFASDQGSSKDEYKPEEIDLVTRFHKRITVTNHFSKPFYSPSLVNADKKIKMQNKETSRPISVDTNPTKSVQMTKPYSVPIITPVPYPSAINSPVRLTYRAPFELKIPAEMPKPVSVPQQNALAVDVQTKKIMPEDVPFKKYYAISIPLQKSMEVDVPVKKHYAISVPLQVAPAVDVPIQKSMAVSAPVHEPMSADEHVPPKMSVFAKPFLSVGSGSLGFTTLDNGIFKIGSGTLGFISSIGNTNPTPIGKGGDMASKEMNTEIKEVVSLSNGLPRNGAKELTLDVGYKSVPSDQIFGGYFHSHI